MEGFPAACCGDRDYNRMYAPVSSQECARFGFHFGFNWRDSGRVAFLEIHPSPSSTNMHIANKEKATHKGERILRLTMSASERKRPATRKYARLLFIVFGWRTTPAESLKRFRYFKKRSLRAPTYYTNIAKPGWNNLWNNIHLDVAKRKSIGPNSATLVSPALHALYHCEQLERCPFRDP